MLAGIDHVVIACRDPDAAAAELRDTLGLEAAAGGRHEGFGTYNRIVWLADAYLELVGVEDAELARRRPFGAAIVDAIEQRGGGLVSYAIAVDDLEATAEVLRGEGSRIGEVVHGARVRPDGERVEWRTAQFERIGPSAMPFLIEHANTGREWGPQALAERAEFVHPLGSPVLLVRLDIAAADPPSLAAEYEAQLGITFWAVSDLAVATVGRHTIRLVPRVVMPVPAVVTLGAEVDPPRTVEALGLRFDVEHVDLPLPAPNTA